MGTEALALFVGGIGMCNSSYYDLGTFGAVLNILFTLFLVSLDHILYGSKKKGTLFLTSQPYLIIKVLILILVDNFSFPYVGKNHFLT